MLNKNRLFLFLLFSLLLSPLFGQTYATGAIFDPEKHAQTPLKARLITRNYTNIPRTASLRQYSPIPENQGEYGTCTAWSTVFAARTISESIVLNRTNQEQNSLHAFSPLDTYIGIRALNGGLSAGYETFSFLHLLNRLKERGIMGISIPSALDYLVQRGAVRRNETERIKNLQLTFIANYENIRRYTISEYVALYRSYESPWTIEERVTPVKKSISEGKPVIIAMNTPLSFHRARDVWKERDDPNIIQGYHAMCVVGYNDNMHGGAFEIQNSWGTEWGNDGYIWITYNDFAKFVVEAYEIIENLALYRDATRFAASININVFNDTRDMPVTFDAQGFYRTRFAYPNGTVFQFQMTNGYPAYVYAFSADSNTTEIVRVFPGAGVSPVLDYVDSTVAWPDENTGMMLDGTADTHYLVVLYSKQALDINAIEQRFARERGVFPERVARAVGQNFIPYSNVQYSNDKIEFSTVSTDPRSVFGLLLAINQGAAR